MSFIVGNLSFKVKNNFTKKMSDENTSDMFEETCESDSDEPMYFPFIKIENDGSVLIDGQPSSQDASQMSIESAEVLVLPFGGIVDQFESFSENQNDFEEVIEDVDVAEETVIDSPSHSEKYPSISETLLHDHNYEDLNRDPDSKSIFSYVVDQIEDNRTCALCEKSFNTAASLKRHVRIHTGEKPFNCQVCDKRFSQQSNLWKHVRTHTGERPFECPQCHKCFSQRANMKKHLIIHTGERPYICFLCGRGFTQQANLTKHMRLHTGEKPYACSYCDKRFTQRSNLQKHEHLHEGIKPYTCEICFLAFTQQSNLRKHEMMHNNIKKFVCDLCNKGYVQKVSLIKHKQRCSGLASDLVATEMLNNDNASDQAELLNQYENLESPCLDEDDEGIIMQTEEEDYIFIN